ncbi:hypothetical protein niasHS_017074 [Heterodera schachtii]|uniref:C-type lectin domain-containing protein n=1 Tax=Heterodera schachtii TaxID=97005 RepID=A0ABD2I000_HETSC
MRGIKIKAKITLECSPIEDEGKGSSSSKESDSSKDSSSSKQSASSEESSAEHCSSDEGQSPVTKEPPTTKASSSATDEPCDEDAINEHPTTKEPPTTKASSSATDEPCDEDATNEHPTTKEPPTTKASSSATDEPCDEDATNEHPTTKASSSATDEPCDEDATNEHPTTKEPPTTKASSSATDEPCDEDATNEHPTTKEPPTTKASSSATDEPCDEDATNEHPTTKASSSATDEPCDEDATNEHPTTKEPPTTKASSSATDEPCDEDAINEHPTTKEPPTTKASSSATDEPCDEDATNEHPTTKASSTKKPPTTKASSSATDEPCDEEKATKEPITSNASSSATEATSQASSSVTEEPCNGETSTSPSCAFVCSGFGWTIYNGNCYKVVEGLMNQSQAVAACNAEDSKAQLVSIADEAENRLLGRIIAQPLARSLLTYQLSSTIFNTFWIGLRRVRVGNLYQSTWSNGSPATFGNVPEITTAATTTGTKNQYPWAEGQPSGTNKYTDPTGANEECVHMINANGQWNDARCAIQMTGAICKKAAQAVGIGSQAAVTPVGTGQIRVQSAGSSAAPSQASSSSFDLCNPSVSMCGGFGWTIFNGKCYKVVEGLMNQSQAVAACNAEDSKAQLVSIADEAENRLLGRIIAQPLARSLLTYKLSSTIFNTFWIGLRRVRVGNLYQSTWSNGSPATFGNVPEITTAATTTGTKNQYPWAEGQPSGTNKYTDPTGANEECVHMINANGQWNDARCAIQMTGAICQKTAQF